MPLVTQTDTYTAADTPVTDSFTDPTLCSLFAVAGGIQSDPTTTYDVLRQYVVATGRDGYDAVVSAEEIAGAVGNEPVLVGIADTEGTLHGEALVARLTVSGDMARGRYLVDLTSLQVDTMLTVGCTVAPSLPACRCRASARRLDRDRRHARGADAPQRGGKTVIYRIGSTSVTDTCTGVLLWGSLSVAGIMVDPTMKNDVLHKLVSVTRSDGYHVDLSPGELEPAFGDEPILLAYADTDGNCPAATASPVWWCLATPLAGVTSTTSLVSPCWVRAHRARASQHGSGPSRRDGCSRLASA